MSLNLDQIFEDKRYSIWCFLCNDCTSVESTRPIYYKTDAEVEFYAKGWIHIKGKGYLCPSCQKKEGII